MTLMTSKPVHAAESQHWYTKDGYPAYEVMSQKGTMRPTTLRDARKMGLVPSVTTIIRQAASPGLDAWKQQQVLHAALTLPLIQGESEEDYLDRIMKDSKETGRKASERGTALHAAIEGHYAGTEASGEYASHIEGVKTALDLQFGDHQWIPEKSFATNLGFGGKLDLCGVGGVIDIKSKEFGPDSLPKGYDEHLMQLASYRVGIGMPSARCANVFVSVTKPGLVHIVEWSEDDLQRGWKMFCGLLDFWYAKTGLQRG